MKMDFLFAGLPEHNYSEKKRQKKCTFYG